MRAKPHFVLQFDPSELDALAERYGYEDDDEAFEAGRRIAQGQVDRETLKVIMRWKSKRRVKLIDKNTDSEIATALQVSTSSATTEQEAVKILDKLHGVGIPMASAILTAINPEKYTILDYRALESLGVNRWPNTVTYYLEYLTACRELVLKYGKTLRNFDRALWQWSKEKSKAKGACASSS